MQGRIKHEQIIIKIGVMLGLLWLSALPALSQDLGVVPKPQAVERTNEFFWLDESTLLVLGAEAGKHERFAVAEFQDALRNRLSLNLVLTYDLAAGDKPNSILIGNPEDNPKVASRMDLYGLSLTEDMLREGYVLGIGEHGVVIGAHNSAGILYGTITLKQIVFSLGGAPLPGVKIHDWPFFSMRGIQDEISYGQVSTMENFKDIIRFLAEFKMNTFMIYLEDTFRFEAYPTIGIGRGALTREQVDELEAFAKPYNVEIIPIFEMLANQGALLMLDEIRPLAEYPGAHSFAISEDSYEFFENCTRELTAAFDSKYFHAGLDESWDLGYGRTEELVKQKGKAVVHAEHYRRLNDMLRRHNKKMMMYSDIVLKYAHILELIPKDIVLMYWKYAPWDRYPEVVQHVEKGFELVVLPGMNNWNQFFPTMSAAMINIKNLTLEAAHHHALGSVTSTWGDYGSKNLRELLYCGYAYQGEVAWSPQTHDVSDFNRRFFTLWNGPGTSAYFIAIYELLEKWPVLWHKSLPDYFRHPFLPRKKGHKPTAQELYRVYHNAQAALELIEQVRPIIKYRKTDLDYLRYCALSYQNYVDSQQLVRQLNGFTTKEYLPEEVQQVKAQFIEKIQKISTDLATLRDMFESLWLRTNLSANLHYSIDDYERLIKVWQDAEQRVKRGLYAYNPVTPAQWIYHPDGFAQQAQVQHTYFRKTFTRPAALKRAHVQLYGDTYVKLYVNGKFLGEQFVRNNLSAPVNPNLLKVYDIAGYLKEDKNIIAVEAHNYGTDNSNLDPSGPLRCGGFHLYGEIVDKQDNKDLLISDSSWKVSDSNPPGWNGVKFDDENWVIAQANEKPRLLVTYPDFVCSWRGFGDSR